MIKYIKSSRNTLLYCRSRLIRIFDLRRHIVYFATPWQLDDTRRDLVTSWWPHPMKMREFQFPFANAIFDFCWHSKDLKKFWSHKFYEMPSTKLDHYEVLETIGSGSYGTCRKVRRRSDNKVGFQLYERCFVVQTIAFKTHMLKHIWFIKLLLKSQLPQIGNKTWVITKWGPLCIIYNFSIFSLWVKTIYNYQDTGMEGIRLWNDVRVGETDAGLRSESP